jgi:hexosaminidase
VGVEDKFCCAGSEQFRTFIKDGIDELTELFPYPYFHIGGDEVPKSEWKKCPKCQGEIKSKGLKNENHLQGYLTNEVAEYLKSKGKRTIIWDERLGVNYNPDIILQWWRGEKRKAQSLDRIKNKENVIVSYCPYFYFDYPYVNVPLNKTYSFEPEVLKVKGEYSRYIMGLESCLWTEWVRDVKKFDLLLYPRMQAFAETCWTHSEKKDYNDFEKRLNNHKLFMEKSGISYAQSIVYNVNQKNKRKRWKTWFSNGRNGYDEIILNEKSDK